MSKEEPYENDDTEENALDPDPKSSEPSRNEVEERIDYLEIEFESKEGMMIQLRRRRSQSLPQKYLRPSYP